MNPLALESKNSQIVCRVIGWPITLLSLILSVDGIGIGLGGLQNRDIWAIIFCSGTLLSYIGLIGAWWRLNVRYATMSPRKVKFVRYLLVAGILGGCALAVGAVGIFGSYGLVGSAFFIMLAFAGVIFFSATPISF